MAHEIEERDGTYSFFQVIRRNVELAWHSLGTYFNEDQRPQNTAEALKACRGDFDAELRPQTFTAYTDSGDTFQKESTLSAAIVRTDTNAEIGTASPSFEVVQHHEVMRSLDPFISEGLATIETAGVLRDGQKVFMLMRWNIEQFGDVCREAFGNEIKAYGLAVSSLSGKDSIGFYDTDVTVVCANTERMAVNSATSKFLTKHTRNARLRVLDGVEKLWGGVVAQREAVGRDILALRQLIIDEATFRRMVLDVVAPLPDLRTDGRSNAGMVQRAEDRRELLSALWTGGLGHKGDGSAWEAYTAVTEAADHSNALWKPKTLEARAEGLIYGAMADTKLEVFSGLLALTK
jgi:phage/plasmid-like protein (TIGR03299 family)